MKLLATLATNNLGATVVAVVDNPDVHGQRCKKDGFTGLCRSTFCLQESSLSQSRRVSAQQKAFSQRK